MEYIKFQDLIFTLRLTFVMIIYVRTEYVSCYVLWTDRYHFLNWTVFTDMKTQMFAKPHLLQFMLICLLTGVSRSQRGETTYLSQLFITKNN